MATVIKELNFTHYSLTSFHIKKYADEIMAKYQAGHKTSIYYNPESPQNSCLITSKNISAAKYGLMVAILFIFIAIFVVGLKYFNKLFS